MMNRHEMCVSLQSLGAQEQAWIQSGELNEGLPKTWVYIYINPENPGYICIYRYIYIFPFTIFTYQSRGFRPLRSDP